MKVLLATHGVFLDPARISSGNSVRAYFLAQGLVAAGHEVTFAYPQALERFSCATAGEAEPGIQISRFADKADFQQLLASVKPDVILIGYWELVDLLPDNPGVPVILDVVAPRVLEAMFQPERDMADEVRQMLAAYRRADRFLVGTERQRHFLLPWLIMAGIDCRFDVPVDVVPISTFADETSPCPADSTPLLRFVSGGVSWPWRRTESWFDALLETLQSAPQGAAKFTLFAGEYVYGGQGDGRAEHAGALACAGLVEAHGLLGYGDMQHYLETQCSVGIELADRNIEREYSQSFRAMEFLRAGLPLICNGYLEIAESVRAYDAGWVVDERDQIPGVIASILSDRNTLQQKSANARRLVNERFHFTKTIQPVLRFMASPRRLTRGDMLFQTAAASDQIADSTAPEAAQERPVMKASMPAVPASGIKMQVKRKALAVLRRLLTALRGARVANAKVANDIIIVTRSDVFPTDHGAAVKIDRTAAALSCLGKTVYLVTDDRQHYVVYRDGVPGRAVFPYWLQRCAPLRERVRQKVIDQGVPADDAFLYYPVYDWSYILRTLYLALRHPVGIFQAEFPAYARACVWARRLLGGKVVLVEHNVEYQRLRDQARDLPERAFHFLSHIELGLCARSDVVIAVSERDRATLVQDGIDAARVHYVPHGVDLAAFDSAGPAPVREQYAIPDDTRILAYHGTYLYPPNLEAMQVMAKRILPLLTAQGVKVKVLALGNHPPSSPLHEDIIFTGSVAQVAPYLRAADIAVVPLLKGGGTRMKILDYFAAALPVVSTRKGIEGIPANDGEDACIVECADEAFAQAIAGLIADPQKAHRIGEAGRAYVEALDWKEIARRYMALVGGSD